MVVDHGNCRFSCACFDLGRSGWKTNGLEDIVSLFFKWYGSKVLYLLKSHNLILTVTTL